MNKGDSILKKAAVLLCFEICFAIATSVLAHEGHHKSVEPLPTAATKNSLEKINESYLKDVKPIFQNKCFDCHGPQVRFPWYQKIPGIRQFIENDISEAKEHIDMQNDFPFKSHATPFEDLEAIGEDVEENEMPPMSYRWMHPDTALNSEEKKVVQQWVQFGKDLLKSP
jgi:hypothetical protein